jgi:hypothetical protein
MAATSGITEEAAEVISSSTAKPAKAGGMRGLLRRTASAGASAMVALVLPSSVDEFSSEVHPPTPFHQHRVFICAALRCSGATCAVCWVAKCLKLFETPSPTRKTALESRAQSVGTVRARWGQWSTLSIYYRESVLYGHKGRLSAQNGGFWPGQTRGRLRWRRTSCGKSASVICCRPHRWSTTPRAPALGLP